jgi:hypothetical protein
MFITQINLKLKRKDRKILAIGKRKKCAWDNFFRAHANFLFGQKKKDGAKIQRILFQGAAHANFFFSHKKINARANFLSHKTKKGRNIIKNGDPGSSKGMTDNGIPLPIGRS